MNNKIFPGRGKKDLSTTNTGSHLFKTILLIMAGCVVIVIMGMNGFPEFIRAIRGPDFLDIFLFYTLAVFLISATILVVSVILGFKASCERLSAYRYSDEDLMLCQNFTQYRVNGYYIMRARFQGLLNMSESGEIIDSKDPEEYEGNDYQILKLIADMREGALTTRWQFPITASDIVIGLQLPCLVYNKSVEAFETETRLDSRKYLKYALITYLPIFYLGMLKVTMGLTYGKNIESLIIYSTVLPFVLFSYHQSVYRVALFIKKNILRKYILKNLVNTYNELENVDNQQRQYLHRYAYSHIRNTRDPILYSVCKFERMYSRSGGSTFTSGCSSCGGGGGGGGGCGGCGD